LLACAASWQPPEREASDGVIESVSQPAAPRIRKPTVTPLDCEYAQRRWLCPSHRACDPVCCDVEPAGGSADDLPQSPLEEHEEIVESMVNDFKAALLERDAEPTEPSGITIRRWNP